MRASYRSAVLLIQTDRQLNCISHTFIHTYIIIQNNSAERGTKNGEHTKITSLTINNAVKIVLYCIALHCVALYFVVCCVVCV